MRAPALTITIALCAIASGALSAPGAQASATDTVGSCWSYHTSDAHVRAEVVARGLTVPVSIAFLPDGRAIVAERPLGRLSFVDLRTGALTPITGVPPVVSEVDGGLLDVIAHPDFARNGVLYFAYTEHTDSGNATVVERARLERTQLEDRTRMLAVHPYIDNVNQFGARLVLDHGYLYIALGDRELPELAQDLSTDAGKIVRLREDGSIPADNPFVNVAGARPEIWSLGHRNPHGLTIAPRTGALWEHEHGPRGGDEINIIRAGRNYGWPVVTYGIEYSGEPVGAGLTHREGMEEPSYYYVPSIAPSGMAFYTGADFPRWRNNIFLGSLSYRHLNRVVLDGDRVVREERLLRDRGWRIREVRQGLDGFLYIGVENGLLVRLRPEPEADERSARCARGIVASDAWTSVPGRTAPASPVAALAALGRADASTANDIDHHRTLLWGGAPCTDRTLWSWDEKALTAVDTTGPPARKGAAITYDPTTRSLVLAGGHDCAGHAQRESWRWDGARWTRLSALPRAPSSCLVYSAALNRMLFFAIDSVGASTAWKLRGAKWEATGPRPPTLRNATCTVDAASARNVLAGRAPNADSSQTWLLLQ